MNRATMPIISIIVPCYNGEQFLRETLDCLKKQTIEDWECIIVNDGSTDNSLTIAREYEALDARYRVIDKVNGGVAIARNVGIAAAEGKYILPLDADDLIAPSYVEKAVDYMERHSDTKLVYCKATYFGDINEPLIFNDYSYDELPYYCSIFCSCIYRRVDFEKTKGYNPDMIYHAEDWDFLLSFIEEKDKVYCIPETLFFYRKHGESRNSTTDKSFLMSQCQMILNHPERYCSNVKKTRSWINLNRDDYLSCELEKVLQSKTYRLGRCLLLPYRWLRTIIG